MNYQEPNLGITWTIENDVFIFTSKRNILIPTLRFLISNEFKDKISMGSSMSVGGSKISEKTWKTNDDRIFRDSSIEDLKYISSNIKHKIPLSTISLKEDWIIAFGILGVDGKVYEATKE